MMISTAELDRAGYRVYTVTLQVSATRFQDVDVMATSVKDAWAKADELIYGVVTAVTAHK